VRSTAAPASYRVIATAGGAIDPRWWATAGALTAFAALTRAREARAGRPTRIGRGGAEQTDRLEPPGRRCGC